MSPTPYRLLAATMPTGSAPPAPPPGRCLLGARLLWLIATALALALVVAAIPYGYEQIQLVCVAQPCPDYQLTAEDAREWAARGITPRALAAYDILVGVGLRAVVCFGIAAAIARRRFDDERALLVALLIVLLGANGAADFLSDTPTIWRGAAALVQALMECGLVLFCYLFPDGRFAPRWARWPAALAVGLTLLEQIFPGTGLDPNEWPFPLNALCAAFVLGGMLAAQVYRYRRVSGPLERQQTKWVIFGVAAAVGTLLIILLLNALFPSLGRAGTLADELGGTLADELGGTAIGVSLLLIPVAIGVAVLRYRLFDIDILIGRTLVYGTLTASVIGLYALVVGGLGALFRAHGSPIVALIATGVSPPSSSPCGGGCSAASIASCTGSATTRTRSSRASGSAWRARSRRTPCCPRSSGRCGRHSGSPTRRSASSMARANRSPPCPGRRRRHRCASPSPTSTSRSASSGWPCGHPARNSMRMTGACSTTWPGRRASPPMPSA